MSNIVTTVVLCSLLTFGASAQIGNEAGARRDLASTLRRNTERLTVSILLDKQKYFPAETAIMTLRISNDLAFELEAFDLTVPRAQLRHINGPSESQLSYELPAIRRYSPGETISQSIVLDSIDCDSKGPARFYLCGIAGKPGSWPIALVLGQDFMSRAVSYEVVSVEILQVVELPTRPWQRKSHDIFGRPDGKIISQPSFIRAYHLSSQGRDAICTSHVGISLKEAASTSFRTLIGSLSCIHEVEGHVESLELLPDIEDGFRVQLRERGKNVTIPLDRNRRIRKPVVAK